MLNWFKRRRQKASSYETNEDWVKGLSSPVDNDAVQKLRTILIRSLKPALAKYVDRELDQFVEDVAQDALLKILDHVHTFRGDSKFTTWAIKIAVREGLTELRRKRYDDISIEDLKYNDNSSEVFSLEIAGQGPDPNRMAHEKMLIAKVMNIIKHELTYKQKTAINALMIQGLPISVVSELMQTTRNALYKLVHDARLKLKHRLEEEGINPDEILSNM